MNNLACMKKGKIWLLHLLNYFSSIPWLQIKLNFLLWGLSFRCLKKSLKFWFHINLFYLGNLYLKKKSDIPVVQPNIQNKHSLFHLHVWSCFWGHLQKHWYQLRNSLAKYYLQFFEDLTKIGTFCQLMRMMELFEERNCDSLLSILEHWHLDLDMKDLNFYMEWFLDKLVCDYLPFWINSWWIILKHSLEKLHRNFLPLNISWNQCMK